MYIVSESVTDHGDCDAVIFFQPPSNISRVRLMYPYNGPLKFRRCKKKSSCLFILFILTLPYYEMFVFRYGR